jgi:hypothetical protein
VPVGSLGPAANGVLWVQMDSRRGEAVKEQPVWGMY